MRLGQQMAMCQLLVNLLRLFHVGSRGVSRLNTGDQMRILRITGFDSDGLCSRTMRNLPFVQYELAGRIRERTVR